MSPKTIASLSRDFMEFKCLIWKTMGTLKNQMELLTVSLDCQEMASCRQVLILYGLSELLRGSHTSQAILVIKDKLKIASVSSSDTSSCHRLGADSSKPRPLLVRFAATICGVRYGVAKHC
ncbi:hypothetical protein PYW08_006096 [Mythimna loreyi]|uniref:Uncharacterized protein n=1 Tax=Mythimna loreyi TaxID=667449 RepID=A0ACC2QNS2_9NEOP|nr:hypothetical protein PYW08_006096 [Mythimna loreyi]